MKKYIAILILVLAVAFAPSYLAYAGVSGHAGLLDNALGEILESQNSDSVQDIECEKVTDNQFEKLGDAVMGFMHPDEKQHELMDQMMGGEGSDQLRAMHVIMGRNYLGCSGGSLGSFGMMGGPMMGAWSSPGNNNFNSMMGFGWIGLMFMILFWALVIVGLVALIKWTVGANRGSAQGKSALDILKERYAKGEIDREEFEQKKKEISDSP